MQAFRILLSSLAVASVASVAAAGSAPNLTTSKTYDTQGARVVRIDFKAGDLEIGASDTDDIQVTMSAHCRCWSSSCERRARNVRLVTEPEGDALVFRLEGQRKSMPGMAGIGLKFLVPRSMAVHVTMGAGDVEIRDLAGNVKLHMGAGDVNIHSAEAAVGQVDLHVGVGDASLRVGRHRVDGRGFLSKHLNWREGLGNGLVDVDLGAGDVSVALD